MATRWVLATGNAGKRREFEGILRPAGVELIDLSAPPLEVDEVGVTFEQNAILKAGAWAEEYGLPALADDSGLEVDALGGAPGVYSARFAGPDAGDSDNNARLMAELAGVTESARGARFRCSLALIIPGEGSCPWGPSSWPEPGASAEERGWTLICASGHLEGRIALAARGEGGFGYDPIFELSDGRHLAELEADEKNSISHRNRALVELLRRLG